MALNQLSDYKEEADLVLPVLTQALQHTNVLVGIRAARALRAVHPQADEIPAVQKVLLNGTRAPQADVRREAAINLGYAGRDPAVVLPVLIELLKDSAEEVRMGAARGLPGLRTNATPAVPALREALADPSLIVRTEASNALKQIEAWSYRR